ncbi:hypothetical protein [Tumidithrix helvetica]
MAFSLVWQIREFSILPTAYMIALKLLLRFLQGEHREVYQVDDFS